MSGVEAVQPQAALRQIVEVGCLEFRVTIVASVAPALIISHDEDDVGLRRWCCGVKGGLRSKQRQSYCEEDVFHLTELLEGDYAKTFSIAPRI